MDVGFSEDDYLCYDITSISSYSALNEYIKYGHNRDLDKLPQLNLAILFSQKGRLPVYFERTPGNITDVTTLHNLLKTIKAMETKTERHKEKNIDLYRIRLSYPFDQCADEKSLWQMGF